MRPVLVLIASFNTRHATELCVRSLRRTAGHPYRLTVGDGGSDDGSVRMLERLAAAGWLELIVEPGRSHTQWLDGWRERHPDGLLLYCDSDMYFRRPGWMAEMARAIEGPGTGTGCAMVFGELVAGGEWYVEPVGRRPGRLASRPSTWLLMVDAARLVGVEVGFGFTKVDPAPVPEGMILFDVGAALFGEVERRGLGGRAMPPEFRRGYVHYEGLSWIPIRGRRGLKKLRDQLSVRLRLLRLRALDAVSPVPAAGV